MAGKQGLFRESNIEMLRIIAMLMIVTLHYLNGQMGGGIEQRIC